MLMLVGHEHWMILVSWNLESITQALGKDVGRKIGCEYSNKLFVKYCL
jgi:hypothetical protein